MLTTDRDNEYLMIDSTIARAHQQAATGKGRKDQALGRSRGGLTTKIHMLADALGRPLRFRITAGQAHDSNALRETITQMAAEALIPSKRNRKVFIPLDIELYKQRNRIERCFGRLKHFGRFATRDDRRTIHFAGFIHLAAVMIWLQ